MRYRGARHLPEWLENGAPVLRDGRIGEVTGMFNGETRPICIEIGCGKGGFIQQMAQLYPDRLFVGIDRVVTVLAKGASGAVDRGLDNVRFIIGDIEQIGSALEGLAIERLFLNFSDPWPRRRQEPRRLTAADKLHLYRKILGQGGCLEQKTDNRPFFDWSVASFEQSNWSLEEIERGFSAGEADAATLSSRYVQTEYEQKFRQQGIPICYLRATP